MAYHIHLSSVRISSNTTYNTGLFILDLNKAPWGCGKTFVSPAYRLSNKLEISEAIWPAFWTVGGNWPNVRLSLLFFFFLSIHLCIRVKNGEIDILEGVHDNEHNQVAWHTNPGISFPHCAFDEKD